MNCLLLVVRYLALHLILVSAIRPLPDCIDRKRRLRCVIREDCPDYRIQFEKKCPSGFVCCRKYKSNPYLPLRIIPDQDESPIVSEINDEVKIMNVKKNDKIVKEKFVFPSESNDIQNRTLIVPSYRNKIGTNVEVLEYKSAIKPKNNSNIVVSKKPQDSQRKSVRACERYVGVTMEDLYFMHLLPDTTPLRIAVDKCEPIVNPLIVGGVKATIKDYPHMAALGYEKSGFVDYMCGGSLISENFVLTAAHCTNTRWGGPVQAQLGSARLYSKDATIAKIKETIPHPEYKPPSCHNDIGLLRLENSVTFTMSLRPACLPTYESEMQVRDKVLVATGWGRTGFGEDSSQELLKTSLKTVSNQECGEYYRAEALTVALRGGITSKMLCAKGHTNDEQDTCQGDSGGPLQGPLQNHECMSQVLAITSFGKICGEGTPAVYTRVVSYLSWIEDIVW